VVAGNYCPAGTSPTQCPAGIVEWNIFVPSLISPCCVSPCCVVYFVFSSCPVGSNSHHTLYSTLRKIFGSSRRFISYHMLRLSGRYLGRPSLTCLAHDSRQYRSLFSFTSRCFRFSALARHFHPLSPEISFILNTFNLYSCIVLLNILTHLIGCAFCRFRQLL
jgi:hypothetical protein